MPGWLWIPIGFGIFNVLLLALLSVGHIMMGSKEYTMICQMHDKICKKEEEGTEQ